jgi:hypothetical protein
MIWIFGLSAATERFGVRGDRQAVREGQIGRQLRWAVRLHQDLFDHSGGFDTGESLVEPLKLDGQAMVVEA